MTAAFVTPQFDPAKVALVENRPTPESMTPDERFMEVLELRGWYTLGLPGSMVEKRVQLLIGRSFQRPLSAKLDWATLDPFYAWINSLECLPAVDNLQRWQALAEEARRSYSSSPIPVA